MCGRYTLSLVDGKAIADRFSLPEPPVSETLGRCNVCPTESIAVVLPGPRARAVRWGITPRGERGWSPINARAESALRNGLWARLLRQGRCLVLADGWYEWLKAEKRSEPRVPFRYTIDDGAPFAFAGLTDGHSAAILTTRANSVCAPVHDRMPCVLDGPDAEAAWLAGALDALELAPLAEARVTVAPANPAVNRAGVEGFELLSAPPRG
jgi:putative SOS response-associated peptidase YedK